MELCLILLEGGINRYTVVKCCLLYTLVHTQNRIFILSKYPDFHYELLFSAPGIRFGCHKFASFFLANFIYLRNASSACNHYTKLFMCCFWLRKLQGSKRHHQKAFITRTFYYLSEPMKKADVLYLF